MIPTGVFNVGPYECYAVNVRLPYTDVILVDALPLLQAERAVSSVARLLNSTDLSLARMDLPKGGARYSCRVNNIKLEALNKWISQ